MRTCIERLISRAHVDSKTIRMEIDFITGTLEQIRADGKITNDAYLDAGAVHGALSIIAEHVDLGIPQREIQDLLRQQISRAEKIEEKHPGINDVVESHRE